MRPSFHRRYDHWCGPRRVAVSAPGTSRPRRHCRNSSSRSTASSRVDRNHSNRAHRTASGCFKNVRSAGGGSTTAAASPDAGGSTAASPWSLKTRKAAVAAVPAWAPLACVSAAHTRTSRRQSRGWQGSGTDVPRSLERGVRPGMTGDRAQSHHGARRRPPPQTSVLSACQRLQRLHTQQDLGLGIRHGEAGSEGRPCRQHASRPTRASPCSPCPARRVPRGLPASRWSMRPRDGHRQRAAAARSGVATRQRAPRRPAPATLPGDRATSAR